MNERIDKILEYAEQMRPDDDAQRAVQGFLIGAAFALKQAMKYGKATDRPQSHSIEDYSDWAQSVLNGTESSSEDMLFGYYMNDALFRCAALSGRVGTATQDHRYTFTDLGERIQMELNLRMGQAPKDLFAPLDFVNFLDEITRFFADQRGAKS